MARDEWFLQPRPKVRCIAGNPIASRRDREWRAERKLPHKKKRNQPSQTVWPVDLAQITVRTTRVRHGRAQFCPNQTVAHGKDGTENPSQHGLWPSHRCHYQGNSDERANPDHVDHVERGCAAQSHAANQLRRSLSGLWGGVIRLRFLLIPVRIEI